MAPELSMVEDLQDQDCFFGSLISESVHTHVLYYLDKHVRASALQTSGLKLDGFGSSVARFCPIVLLAHLAGAAKLPVS